MQITNAMVASGPDPSAPSLMQRFGAVRRRIRPMALAFALVFGAAALVALLWPPTYRSTGTILIEQQEVPTEFVRSAVTSYADQRVQMISQRVMTSANLLGVIDKYKLYPADRARAARETLVDRMRDDIKLDMISADVVDPNLGRATKATIAFSVSFDSRSPVLATQVANELTTLYLSENIQSRKQLAADTAGFLKDESERLGGRVAELESKIAAFKSQHGTELPEYGALNMQSLERSQQELRAVEVRMQSLDQQLVYLDAQLAQIMPTANYSESGERVLAPADRLRVLQSQLAAARARYSAEHPDVVRLRTEIDRLQAQLGASSAAMPVTPATPAHSVVNATDPGIDNPTYIQLRAQRSVGLNERVSLATQIPVIRAHIADLEHRQTLAPEVERNYTALQRDLAGEQLKYNEVRQKLLEAQLSQNLETERKGERFTLIEPPLEPQQPVKPNRVAIVLLGFVLSGACAFGLMVLLEALDTCVRDRAHLLELLTVPPLAVIPLQELAEERAARRRQRRNHVIAGAAVFGIALLAVHLFVRPLDLVWLSLLRRLGA